MNDAERARILAMKLAAERSGELRWWWLSFIDPEGAGFLGVAIVEASGPLTAVERAVDLGVNPGGEVAILPLPYPPRPEDCERLLTSDEAKTLQRRWAQ